MSRHQLSEPIHREVTGLSEPGHRAAADGQYDEAIKAYVEALSLLPQPVEDWEAATWLFTAIGEGQFFKGDLSGARESLMSAMRSPGGIGNPFIHLRLGQVQMDLGNLDRARDELIRAYMGAGEETFQGEDPKYWAF